MKPVTAFVGHADCARHDTGWKHPEHQGRLPALVRAVYRDMLTLHDHLREVEAQPASEDDLRLIHTDGYIARVREASRLAAQRGEPIGFEADAPVSGASWNAALAAVGGALTAVDLVLAGEVRNAFCAARPPGAAARADRAGGHALFNTVAIAARHLRERRGLGRVLVVEWRGSGTSALGELLGADPGVRLVGVGTGGAAAAAGHRASMVSLPPGTDAGLFLPAFEAALDTALAEDPPEFMLLAAGFDVLATDPLGGLALDAADVHPLTARLRERADAACAGRLVSVLEGGYDPPALGRAVVQHLRALAGLPSA